MKKSLLLFPLIFGLILTGCIKYNGSTEESDDPTTSSCEPTTSGSEPTSSSTSESSSTGPTTSSTTEPGPIPGEITTYLVLTPNGQYQGKYGIDVPDLFLENTIVFHGAAGSSLPDGNEITVTTGTGVFESWVSYENTGAPTVYNKVPNKDGTILYAKFKDSGEVKPTPTPQGELVYYFTNNWCWSNLHIYMWKGETKNADWPGNTMTYAGKNNYGEDVYKFTLQAGQYDNCIISGHDDGLSIDVQTTDISFSSFGSADNLYITRWNGEKVDVGFATYTPAEA